MEYKQTLAQLEWFWKKKLRFWLTGFECKICMLYRIYVLYGVIAILNLKRLFLILNNKMHRPNPTAPLGCSID